MGVMYVLNHTGHSEIAWSADDVGSVALAEEEFEVFSSLGYSAFTTTSDLESMTRLNDFTPQAEEIVWIRPLVGG